MQNRFYLRLCLQGENPPITFEFLHKQCIKISTDVSGNYSVYYVEVAIQWCKTL